MFQYECEKPSRLSSSADWRPAPDRGPRRPLPPRPVERIPNTSVPLKVWIVASASCFAVCAALVLATVVITKWGTADHYTTRELFAEPPEPIYSNLRHQTETPIDNLEKDMQVLEKLSLFKNIVANRDKTEKSLLSKPQMHPLHEDMHHTERKIEKKDQPREPDVDIDTDLTDEIINTDIEQNLIPDFKPLDVKQHIVKLPDNFVKYKQEDFDEYYDDINLYEDYMQSNSITNYLMEKVEELHDWVIKDPDFDSVKNSTKRNLGGDFSKILKGLNSSLVEGDVTIILKTLKDLYFGELSNTSKSLLSNTTDLVSFGILNLDVMLLHNIQMMAWESQESARIKMMKDPDVFAFNALFLDQNKMEAMQNEIQQGSKRFGGLKNTNAKQDIEEEDFVRYLMKNILDIGMSTARAAIHLGRAYKNTRAILTQRTNDAKNLPRDGNTQDLIVSGRNASVASANDGFYTELDCIWLLYCRNLVATSKLNPPYGTMARVNGVALRMLTGELSADRAIDTILYEAFTGWKELKCDHMFSRCSKADAASVVMDTIIQSKKQHSTSRGG